MVKWSNGINYVGQPSEIIQQADTSTLNSLLTKVNRYIYEFTADAAEGPSELATGWRWGQWLITNAHATVALLTPETFSGGEKGKYLAKPLKEFSGNQKLVLRLISRENDLAGLFFKEDLDNNKGLQFRTNPPHAGEGVVIVGRTRGTNRKGIMDGRVTKVFDNKFTYDIDTKPGSSGSPILDLNGNVVGIHQGITSKNSSTNGDAIGIKGPIAEEFLGGHINVTEDKVKLNVGENWFSDIEDQTVVVTGLGIIGFSVLKNLID